MFRHGLFVGRRSVRVSTHIQSQPTAIQLLERAATIPVSYSQLWIPFICPSCQIRAYARPRKMQSPMVSSIKRLEKHVQFLETRYKDHVNQEAVEAEHSPVEITEEMQDKAYAALMAPESQITSFLPSPAPIFPLIPQAIVPRLGSSLEVVGVEEDPKWEPILQNIRQNCGFKDLQVKDINKTIFLIPDTQRAQLTNTILSMIEESGVLANTFTFDLLMLAHSALGNVQVVQALFDRLKELGLRPNLRIYAHLLNAYSKTRDVAAASAAFQEMYAAGIKPNLIVYTSLIKTCINREELSTAWEIFNLIKYRSTETAPDITTFSLMIHACAMRGEAEKALDLFKYMTESLGLEPDETLYNSLIHACAVRKDYFLDAWKYAIEMRNKGIKVARWTLNHLLQACGKSGDLTRARLLLRLMMSSESLEYQPDERSFQGLFRAYATAKHKTGARIQIPQDPVFLAPNPSHNSNRGSLDNIELDHLPFLQSSVLTTRKAILTEAKQLLRYIQDFKPSFYSTKILNAYLDVCFTQYDASELRKAYRNYFVPIDTSADADTEPLIGDIEKTPDSTPDPSPEDDEDDYHPVRKPRRNIFTFEIALEYSRRAGALPFAREVWADRMLFCETSEYWNILQPIRRRLDFTAEKLMVQTMAKAGQLKEALDRLKVLQYEFDWTKEDLKPVYDKAREMEDMDAIMDIKVILKLDDRRW